MDTLGIERRASRMLRGRDITTPRARWYTRRSGTCATDMHQCTAHNPTPGLRYKIPVFSDPDPGKS